MIISAIGVNELMSMSYSGVREMDYHAIGLGDEPVTKVISAETHHAPVPALPYVSLCKIMMNKHIEAETQWPPFADKIFKVICVLKLLYFVSSFTDIFSLIFQLWFR